MPQEATTLEAVREASAVLHRELARAAAAGAAGLPARFAVRALRSHAAAEALLADVEHALAVDDAIAYVVAAGHHLLPRHRFCLDAVRAARAA